jgi:hypothetical protein
VAEVVAESMDNYLLFESVIKVRRCGFPLSNPRRQRLELSA